MELEFDGIGDEVIAELVAGRHVREVLELTSLQGQVSRLAASPEGEHGSTNGLGRPVLSIPALAWHYWGQREGYDCWRDKKFRKEYARDNPGARVTQSKSCVVGWTPAIGFKKSYGD